MAVIKGKDLNDLSGWTDKELRKLKINLNNRIQTLTLSSKASELKESHPLAGLGIEECQSLLRSVSAAEKKLNLEL